MQNLLNYLTAFETNYQNTNVPKVSQYACAIIEPRLHSYLEVVIKNMIYFLPGWSVYVFHSKENEEFVHDILKGHNKNNINLIPISEGNITVEEYNQWLANPKFYQMINAKFVLIFQTDSYLRRFGMESYIKENYDYIGAPWGHISWTHQVGNGGLSLRKVDTMIRITNKHPWNGKAEDIYFQHAFVKEGLQMPNKYSDIMRSFSVETIMNSNPVGVHKYWKHFPNHLLDIKL
jgi:hypothetical protein